MDTVSKIETGTDAGATQHLVQPCLLLYHAATEDGPTSSSQVPTARTLTPASASHHAKRLTLADTNLVTTLSSSMAHRDEFPPKAKGRPLGLCEPRVPLLRDINNY